MLQHICDLAKRASDNTDQLEPLLPCQWKASCFLKLTPMGLGNLTPTRSPTSCFYQTYVYLDILAPAGRNVYRPRSIPNSSPSGAKGVYGHMLSDTCHPAGVQETLDTVFYIPVAPLLVLRCDLPKTRGGERCIRRTKLTPMVRLGNRTYRGWSSSPNYLIYFFIFIWSERLKPLTVTDRPIFNR